jgi:hypothetical protein
LRTRDSETSDRVESSGETAAASIAEPYALGSGYAEPVKPQEVDIPKGSYAAGHKVRLPQGAEPPIRVYVNGVEQGEGVDYELGPREIVFARPIVKETVSPGRWAAMYLGLFGTYRKHETVDVEYRRDGKVELASDVAVVPDD